MTFDKTADMKQKVTVANAKHAVGHKRVPLALVPAAGVIHGARAMAYGAEKYGEFNFRESTEISFMVYLHALLRHVYALVDGENIAEDSGVHHLGHVIADAAILLDAIEKGNILDDRPTEGSAALLLEYFSAKVEGKAP